MRFGETLIAFWLRAQPEPSRGADPLRGLVIDEHMVKVHREKSPSSSSGFWFWSGLAIFSLGRFYAQAARLYAEPRPRAAARSSTA